MCENYVLAAYYPGIGWLLLALGLAWFGLVWFRLVWLVYAWFGLAWLGLVWFGLAWAWAHGPGPMVLGPALGPWAQGPLGPKKYKNQNK